MKNFENPKLNANEIQWKETSFYISAEEAKKAIKLEDAYSYKTYILVKKVNGNWQITDKNKTIKSRFSSLQLKPKILSAINKYGYYQTFTDVLRKSSTGEIILGTGSMLFVDASEL